MEKVEFGTVTLFHGDFQEVMPTLGDDSINCVTSDPPYGVTDHHWDIAPPFDSMWKLFEAKSKDNANYVLFGCGKFSIDLINSKYDWYRYNLTWVKNNKTNWLNSGRMVHRNTEDIMLFGKPGFQRVAVFNVPDGFPHPCSALVCDHERGNNQQGQNFHVTQKPLKLMAYLLMLYSNPGDLVLDCFMGSGTTGCAALIMGRRFIGIEKERGYFETACKRLEEIERRRNARRITLISVPCNVPDADETAPEMITTDTSALEEATS
jgi:site-specific DNA-methyltransferase (adenine-specific)